METERFGKDEVTVRLSCDEALVLSGLLDRWCRGDGSQRILRTDDRADSRVLDDLCASFEPVIDEVFADNHGEVVEAARRRIAPAASPD
jgi:hypothetical protein